MFFRRKFHLPIAWAALLAVLFNIALPTLATTNTSESTAWVEVCTASGMKSMSVPLVGDTSKKQTDLSHKGHCQLCPIGLAAYLEPDATVSFPLVAQSLDYAAPRSYALPPHYTGCRPPPSQAPPIFS
jgi:hypothetical protein